MPAALHEAVSDRSDIMALLRSRTAPDHERMHRLPAFAALEAGTLDRDTYGRLLACMLDFYRDFDACAEGFCGQYPRQTEPYRYIPRSVLIARDLVAMGATPAETAGDGPIRFDPPASAAALAGMLYVVDGAMLGGSVLSKQSARFGVAGDGYWQWCRRRAGAQWRDTRDLLARLACSERDIEDMILAARTTFKAFGACMTPGWVPTAAAAPSR